MREGKKITKITAYSLQRKSGEKERLKMKNNWQKSISILFTY